MPLRQGLKWRRDREVTAQGAARIMGEDGTMLLGYPARRAVRYNGKAIRREGIRMDTSKDAEPTSDLRITAQIACEAILRGDSNYRSQPEALGERTAILGQVQAITANCRLDARRLELRYLPAGWATLVRDALGAALCRIAQSGASQVTILVGKEKFGELRLVFEETGDADLDRDLQAIGTWAAEQSRHRCAGTGEPGEITTDDPMKPANDIL